MSFIFLSALSITGTLVLALIFGPRPRLNAGFLQHGIPSMPLKELAAWLQRQEAEVPNLVDGTQARIQWANDAEPEKTRISFLYLHGFSATWRETAPVTANLAAHFSANVIQGRVAGHGEGPSGMLTSAEKWLQSTADQFELAQRVGERVVIVAMSTGAALAVWLVSQPQLRNKIHACLFMSPNFRVRNPFGFLLTWPWSRHWLHLIVGKQRKWEPQSKAESECWTHEYSTLALIEMQKTVNWVNRQRVENIQTPLAIIYLKNDTTIAPRAAINVFHRWGAQLKQLIIVPIDEDAKEHVFAGDITAPHRVEWTVDTFKKFVEEVDGQ